MSHRERSSIQYKQKDSTLNLENDLHQEHTRATNMFDYVHQKDGLVSDEINMDHLELRDDTSSNSNSNSRMTAGQDVTRYSGYRGSMNGDLTRFSGVRRSLMRNSIRN